MTATLNETDAAAGSRSVDSETQRVNDALDALLAAHDPSTMDNAEFRGHRFDAGLAWVHFAEGDGGLGLRPELNRIVERRLKEAGATPTDPSTFFMGLAGPTIATHGDDAVKERFLARCSPARRSGASSSPSPAPDPTSRASATQAPSADGDEWLVNGQKVWNTLAHVADCGHAGHPHRSRSMPKHKGMTYFALDMHAEGVEVRPLRQITGEAEFNEVYMTDVRVPDDCRVGARRRRVAGQR